MSATIQAIINAGESSSVELKGPRSKPEAVAQAVCGLVNARGGLVIWGVDEDGRVAGLADAEERARQLEQTLAEGFAPMPMFLVKTDVVKGGTVVVVEVAEGSTKPHAFKGQFWVRMGNSTMRAVSDEVADMVAERAAQMVRWEREAMPGFTVEDCDRAELRRTRQEMATTRHAVMGLPTDDEGLLARLQLTSGGQLTNAAVVLYASEPDRWAPHLTVRLTRHVPGSRSPSHHMVLSAPAIRCLDLVIEAIRSTTPARMRFMPDSVRRKELEAYPPYVLREALVNAMVHRDYDRSTTGIHVELHPDHLIIRNPATLPEGWTEQDLTHKHQSRPTNPGIANVFLLRGYMEQLGLGIQKIIAISREVKAKAPSWHMSDGMLRVTIYPSQLWAEEELPERERSILDQMQPGKGYYLRELLGTTGVTDRQLRRDLAGLIERGLIMREGGGRSTKYRRVDEHA